MLYLYICQYCITTVIYMSQKGLMQAGGVFCCPSGLSCIYSFCMSHGDTKFNYEEQRIGVTCDM